MLILLRKGLRVQRLETAIERERETESYVAERHNLERLERVKRRKNSPDSSAGSAFGKSTGDAHAPIRDWRETGGLACCAHISF